MFRKKSFWTVLIVFILATGGGYHYYNTVYAQGQTPDEPAIKTARVRKGDQGGARREDKGKWDL